MCSYFIVKVYLISLPKQIWYKRNFYLEINQKQA